MSELLYEENCEYVNFKTNIVFELCTWILRFYKIKFFTFLKFQIVSKLYERSLRKYFAIIKIFKRSAALKPYHGLFIVTKITTLTY